MKRYMQWRDMIGAVALLLVLLYLAVKTTNSRIILFPFLLCAFALAGLSIARFCGKEDAGPFFHKIFAAGFFLFWFGFLLVAAWWCIRQRNGQLLLFSVPFWLVGTWMLRTRAGKSEPKRQRTTQKKTGSGITFPVVMAVGSVVAVIAAGGLLLVLGIRAGRAGMIAGGAFFLLGGFAFVLAVLVLRGCFDRWKIDVLGLYMGSVLVLAGAGMILLNYAESGSLSQFLHTWGGWLLVPLVMIIGGALMIVQCLKNKRPK